MGDIMSTLRSLCLGSVACLAMAAPASAQLTATDTFVVSITVQNQCTVVVNDLDFSTVQSLATEVDAQTTATVTCTGVGPIALSFDAGTGTGSTLALRQMNSGANTISYNLYADASRTQILGDESGSTVVLEATSTGGSDVFDIYGRTTAAQGPKPAGTYTSTVTATIEF